MQCFIQNKTHRSSLSLNHEESVEYRRRADFCRSQDQISGIFTKTLIKEKFEKFRNLLGVAQNETNNKNGCYTM